VTSDARLWHPWLRINRVVRVMLCERWRVEAWPLVKAESRRRSRQEQDPVAVPPHAQKRRGVAVALLDFPIGF